MIVVLAVTVAVLFIVLPVAVVFGQALRLGLGAYLAALTSPDLGSAVWLTLGAAGIATAANLVFGVAAAWAITKFEFRGKRLLLTLIDLPFAVSPVIAGMLFVLVFGVHGWFGGWLARHGAPVIFAPAAIVLVTAFVTVPYVARVLVPLMEAQGTEAEEAAVLLGASGWSVFWRVTLPGIRWGLLYGAVMTVARAMGEFGAVSVVSGHVRGRTVTLPLHVEILYNEYESVAAFAAATLLVGLAAGALMALGWAGRRLG